jgi:hypothetical protein
MKIKTFRSNRFLGLLLLGLVFIMFGCTQVSMPKTRIGSAAASPGKMTETAAEFSSRQGLGTTWGESLKSKVGYVAFERENTNSPDRVVRIFYNDKQGIADMMGGIRDARRQAFEIPNGGIRAGITDEDGGFGRQFLPSVKSNDNYYVRGEHGSRYGISIENISGSRIEVVVSVDGLDVIDGRPAAFGKRGYLLSPEETFVIKGFRQSTEEVAAFRFGTVAESYAQLKYGNAENVGVIGIAVFREKGSLRLGPKSGETMIREKANPFPGKFATPP